MYMHLHVASGLSEELLRARFSKEACARVTFITAHTSKGHT